MPRFNKEKRDGYYREAKVVGYRARSAYKLLQLDELYGILGDDTHAIERVVDLCAAPGSWSQVLSQKLVKPASKDSGVTIHSNAESTHTGSNATTTTTAVVASTETVPSRDPIIVAVDLQEMAPIDGVITLQGDITSTATASKVISYFGGLPADLVICDGAPDVTGIHDLDEYVQSQLLLAAANITTYVLRKGGNFVAKMFKGSDMSLMYAQMEMFFERVDIYKPKSSRSKSMESFLVCRGYRPIPHYTPSMETPSYGVTWSLSQEVVQRASEADINKVVVPFMAIGDFVGFAGPIPSTPATDATPPPDCETTLKSKLKERFDHYQALLASS